MAGIKEFHGRFVEEYGLRLLEGHIMLSLVLTILAFVPRKTQFIHNYTVNINQLDIKDRNIS